MTFVRAMLVLAACLALQLGWVRLSPEGARYLDVLVLPVLAQALRGSQRAAMLTGCASGLLRDAWFEGGVFGATGFARTLLAWALGGLGARLDLNSTGVRVLVGASFVWCEKLILLGLHRMMEDSMVAIRPAPWTIEAVVTGVIAAVVLGVVERRSGGRTPMSRRARRA